MDDRFMRIIVFFDLPMCEKRLLKKYIRFRRYLLNDGYDMLQYSVYSRICKGLDGTEKYIKKLKSNTPAKGAVRAMLVTEKQYASMYILTGSPTISEEKNFTLSGNRRE